MSPDRTENPWLTEDREPVILNLRNECDVARRRQGGFDTAGLQGHPDEQRALELQLAAAAVGDQQ